ncbi:MAG: hypothetical protein SVE93_04180 [Candidatus Thermoplasmatota archaeon]|nr:hypothetical protein [Candidatus Thermoplasmatota archaeon]
MEYSIYLVAFLLVMAPLSAIFISAMDNRAIEEYASMIVEYEERVSNLELEVGNLKSEQKTETRTQAEDMSMITSLVEPQNFVNVLDILTRNLPEKDPALVALSSSDSCTELLTASGISIISIVFSLLKFVISHTDVVLDFVVRLSSYALLAIAGYVTSGRWLKQVPALIVGVLASLPAIIAAISNIFTLALEFVTYLPQILTYISIFLKNIGMFFVVPITALLS